jgi:hypothetical protein
MSSRRNLRNEQRLGWNWSPEVQFLPVSLSVTRYFAAEVLSGRVVDVAARDLVDAWYHWADGGALLQALEISRLKFHLTDDA